MPDHATLTKIIEAWRGHHITTEADYDTYLGDYHVLFAYHSNKIEDAGVSLNQTREVFENGKVINYTGDLRAIFETQNQKECYEWLKPRLVKKEKITPDFILDIHEKLMHGCYDEHRYLEGERPGTWKKHLYGVGLSAGLPPEDIPGEVEYLCNEIKDFHNDDIEKIFSAAAFFHCNIEYLHPFADGNGRTGRTLMNYFLMLQNIPPIIIFDEDKKLYYEALAVFDETEKIDGFVSFMKDEMIKTWYREKRTPSSGKRKMMICL